LVILISVLSELFFSGVTHSVKQITILPKVLYILQIICLRTKNVCVGRYILTTWDSKPCYDGVHDTNVKSLDT